VGPVGVVDVPAGTGADGVADRVGYPSAGVVAGVEPVPLGNSITLLTCPFRQRGWCGDDWLTGCCSSCCTRRGYLALASENMS
jgi:hypothetical protein